MKARQRILDERFQGNERRLEAHVRNDQECRQAILESAGLESGEADVVDFRPHYYGVPDVPCRLRDGRLAIIELAFGLDARHAFKDFAYAADPAAADVAGLIWLCDSVSTSVVDMVRYYASRLGLSRRVTLEILVPQPGRFDAPPPMRYAFDAQLRDLRAGAPYPSVDGITVFTRLNELFQVSDEIDTVALARLLGVSHTWITMHAARPKAGRAPLYCKQAPNGTRLRGADGRFLFDLDRISAFVEELERFVTRVELGNSNGPVLPLVSARDPRIGSHWLSLEGFRRETTTRNYAAIRRRLGSPVAFHISSAGRGYSLLWPVERRTSLRQLPANNNELRAGP